jgi:hypothetical protein
MEQVYFGFQQANVSEQKNMTLNIRYDERYQALRQKKVLSNIPAFVQPVCHLIVSSFPLPNS